MLIVILVIELALSLLRRKVVGNPNCVQALFDLVSQHAECQLADMDFRTPNAKQIIELLMK